MLLTNKHRISVRSITSPFLITFVEVKPKTCSHQERLDHVAKLCHELPPGSGPPGAWSPCVMPVEIPSLGILYCAVYKAGYATWKSVFNHVKGRDSIKMVRQATTTDYVRWANYTRYMDSFVFMLKYLPISGIMHSIVRFYLNLVPFLCFFNLCFCYLYRFTVVRHPFSRLYSSYKNKIDVQSNLTTDTYKNLRTDMIKKYRSSEYAGDLHSGIPTFLEFIKYITAEPQEEWSRTLKYHKYDDHWRPQADINQPCHMNYNYILKLETLDTDGKVILDLMGDNWGDSGMPHENPSQATQTWLEAYKEIPRVYIDKLKLKYSQDFDFFGYFWGDEQKC